MASIANHFAGLLEAIKTNDHAELATKGKTLMDAYKAGVAEDFDDKAILKILARAGSDDALDFLAYPILDEFEE